MLSDELHKELVDKSQNKATIPLAKRYGVHFEYEELVAKLETVKLERESYENTPQPSNQRANQEPMEVAGLKLIRSNTQGKTKDKNHYGFSRPRNCSLDRQSNPKVVNLPRIPLAPSRVSIVFSYQQVLPYHKQQRIHIKPRHFKLRRYNIA